MGNRLFGQFSLSEPDRFQNRSGFDSILSAAIKDAFQIGFGGHGRDFLVRAVHSVGHDFPPYAILIRYCDRLLSIQEGKTLVMVQMLFVPFRNPPEDAVHEAVRFRQNRGDAISAAIGAERKAVSL